MAGIIPTFRYGNALMSGKSAVSYQVENSVRFDANADYMYRTGGGSPDNRKKWTFSCWLRRTDYLEGGLFHAGADATNGTEIHLNSVYRMYIRHLDAGSPDFALTYYWLPADTTGWHHLCIAFDSTEASSSNRVKFWMNGVLMTAGVPVTEPTLNLETDFGTAVEHRIGRDLVGAATHYLDGALAEIHFTDGVVNTYADFVDKDGVFLIPKRYVGSHGTEGFYLDFKDSSALGTDASANSNNFTLNSITAGDQMVDSPSNTHCGMDEHHHGSAGQSRRAGTLALCDSAGSGITAGVLGSMQIPNTGKWYWEASPYSNGGNSQVGIINAALDNYEWYRASDGNRVYDGGNAAYGATYTTSDVVGVAVDLENGTLEFYKNGSTQGSLDISAGNFDQEPCFAYVTDSSAVSATGFYMDFGQFGFTHTPPDGYKAICYQNLQEPTGLAKTPSMGASVVGYTGNASTQSITGAGHQPDLIWIKDRAGGGAIITDSVRGVNAQWCPSSDAVENTATDAVTSFDADGFSIGDGSELTLGTVNTNAELYSALCLKEGQAYGLDIATVYHFKALAAGDPHTDYGILGTTAAWADLPMWNDTAPTTTHFSVGAYSNVNTNAKLYIAYLFRSITGFSKVFTYEGNGTLYGGPRVYCGFQPTAILLKNADGVYDWSFYNSIGNTAGLYLNRTKPNTTDAEASEAYCAINNEGFTVVSNAAVLNENGSTFIGIAW
jgi:hypothetical protein